jgi:hypothetical protein
MANITIFVISQKELKSFYEIASLFQELSPL